ncbi:MAG: E2 ligase fold family C protein [Dehalococcoidales bacterium]|nr:E2 ligase fold family C protein [Dehalococcoidales bacterium]
MGLAVGEGVGQAAEGVALADLSIRLLARLYPRLQIDAPIDMKERLATLAQSINPKIDLVDDEAHLGISLGQNAKKYSTTVFAGSQGWTGLVGTVEPLPMSTTLNPLGAGVAACLATANIFRFVFLGQDHLLLDRNVGFSAWSGNLVDQNDGPSLKECALPEDVVLVGLGAIGNGALWALGLAGLSGTIHLVDYQSLELSNLQRYVLATRSDEGLSKLDIATRALDGSDLRVKCHNFRWQAFVAEHGTSFPNVLVALDSAKDRRAVQATLPGWIANAWTQPGDLGVSRHGRFGGEGACLSCLYLPHQKVQNEDALVAEALGVRERQQQVRDLLHLGSPVPDELLAAIGRGLNIPLERLSPFSGVTIRTLYVEGLCGGALLGLGRIGSPQQEVHVPLAHQSSLAGVLLAGAFMRHMFSPENRGTTVTRVNVLRPLGVDLTQPQARTTDGQCICNDVDYVTVFKKKWPA